MFGARPELIVRRTGRAPVRVPLDAPGTYAVHHVEVDLQGTGEHLTWSVANAGPEAVRLDAIGISWREGPAGDDARLFANGYQSWSPTGMRRLGVDEDPSRAPGSFPFVRSLYHADPEVVAPGELRSEQVLLLDLGRGGPLSCAGFDGGATHEGTFRIRRVDDEVEVTAEAFLGGATLPPGARRTLHSVTIERGDDGPTLLATAAARAGRAEHARIDAPYQVGWCSWYHYFGDVTEQALLDNLARASQWPFEVFQLDDGFQSAIGDWLATNDKFPAGVEGVAARIAAAGYTPGLWLAPFLAAPSSLLATEHPEYAAVDPASGDPLFGYYHPVWGGFMWQLDTTRPDVLAHLEETARTLRDMGYRYLKLDFTFCPTVPGTYADPTRTPAERVRAGYEAVRLGAGADAFILACGCPLGSVVGVVDAMRIGPDVAPSWEIGPDELHAAGYEGGAPSTRNAWVSTLSRSFLHRRLWLNDPDCVMLRSEATRLSPIEARAWALAVGVSGGLALVSDDLALLHADARALLDDVLALGRAADTAARLGPPPRCDDLLATGGPSVLTSASHRLLADPAHPVPRLEVLTG